MPRSRPISLNVLPDVEIEAENIARVVLETYTAAMALSRNEDNAFNAAAHIWREHHPKATQHEAARRRNHHLSSHVGAEFSPCRHASFSFTTTRIF
ncbi:MAG TPA: hypothetical protein VET89_06970 [Stellaceae bacterium]|nr:hypothetical protein [Stellaceae bacterium]